jgi:hypothetical protein
MAVGSIRGQIRDRESGLLPPDPHDLAESGPEAAAGDGTD